MGDFASSSKTTTGTESILTGGQEDVLAQLMDLLGDQLGQGVEAYGGERVAGASELQQQAFDAMGDIFGGEGIYGGANVALGDLLGEYDPTAAKEYWQESVYEPSKMRFQDETLPSVLEPFISSGGMRSGAARRAMGKAGAQFESGMGATLADVLYKGREAHEGRRQQAVGQTQQQAQMLANLGIDVGGMQRGIAGEQAEGDYQKWLGSQAYNNPWLQHMMPGLGVQGRQMWQGVDEQEGWGSMLSGAMSGAGQMAVGLGSMGLMFSDRNLKTDIEYM